MPAEWFWEFGDGHTSNEKHPQHRYEKEGKYKVSLTVSTDSGSDTKVITDCIIIADYSGQTGLVSDVEGNVYNWVGIGTGIWMTSNLKSTKYDNGDIIPTTNPVTLDISGEEKPKYQLTYEGRESYVENFGRLYTWYTINDERNVCPDGWHIPTADEWQNLQRDSGGAYKLLANAGWIEQLGNPHGFSAYPSGIRYTSGYFTDNKNSGTDGLTLDEYSFSNTAHWWSSTVCNKEDYETDVRYSEFECDDDKHAFEFYICLNGTSPIGIRPIYKGIGAAVRCVKD